EATSTGLLMTVSQIFTIIMLFVTNALAEVVGGKLWKGMISLIVLAGIAFIGSLCYRSENKRMFMEKNGRGVGDISLATLKRDSELG
ncbi:UNVERIFIED_CONTAM: hypothetical protein HDU68_006554, partial [Siphonaria sp. JEL0065]